MSLFAEFKRRNVFRVAAAYLVFGWLVLQVADVLFPALSLPEWSITLVAVLLVIGFVTALIVSWVYELTPEGLRRDASVDPGQSVARQTGQRLNVITITMVVLAAGLLLADRLFLKRNADTPQPAIADPLVIEPGPESQASGSAVPEEVIPVVAVLPFKASGSDDGGFLASGLHDDLLTRLAKLGAFRVISRTSMMEYAETTKNMREIGRELGAGYVLEGGVQALGNRVRINAQLIDTRLDEHLWADTYDRELSAAVLFDVQAEIARSVAGQLEITLTESEQALMDDVPTRNTQAYNAYLHGLELWTTGGIGAPNRFATMEAFQKAVQLDPEFALAWARLSIAYTNLARSTGDEEMEESALSALAKARAMQPGLLETELAWVVYLYRGLSEYEQALEALEAIGERAAQNVESLKLKSFLYRRVGRYDDAYETLLEAQRIEPRGLGITTDLANLAAITGRCGAAGEHARLALELSPDSAEARIKAADYEHMCTGDVQRANEILRTAPLDTNWHVIIAREAAIFAKDYQRLLELAETGYPNPGPGHPIRHQLMRAEALRHLGRAQEAEAALDQAGRMMDDLDQQGDSTSRIPATRARYFAMRGDPESARYWVDEYRKNTQIRHRGDRFSQANIRFFYADILARAGLRVEAIAELRVMLEEPGGRTFLYVDNWPPFENLKNDPGYLELRERFGETDQ